MPKKRVSPHIHPRHHGFSKPILVIGISLLASLYATLNAVIYVYGTQPFGNFASLISSLTLIKTQHIGKTQNPTPTPTPSDSQTIYNLPSGKQVYEFSHGPNVTGPKPSTITIDPFTPELGGVQIISVEIQNESPVTLATATLYTDQSKHTYELRLTKGTATSGTWTGSWTVDEVYDHRYLLGLSFTGKN
jgi:hypothetical protein